MPAYTSATERDYLLADGRYLRSGLHKYAAEVAPFGATPARVKALDGWITAVEATSHAQPSSSQEELDQSREDLKTRVRICRACNRAVAHGFDADDPAAARTLLVKNPFPYSDARLVAWVKAVSAGFRKYGSRLADVGFSKAEQEKLVEAGAAFRKLAATVRREKTGKRGNTAEREHAVAHLRRCIQFLRDCGKRAFRDRRESLEFQPITRVKAARSKPVVVPAPEPQQKAAAVG